MDGERRRELGKPLLLIVEDAPESREMLAFVLGDEFELRMARNGAAAIEALEREAGVALGVIDYRLAGESGLDVARALRQRRGALPLILYSAYLDSELERRSGDLPLRVVSKSRGPEELREAVHELLRTAGRESAAP
jgi:CheY-like chemotaxis protein